jgi:hypothetical protein
MNGNRFLNDQLLVFIQNNIGISIDKGLGFVNDVWFNNSDLNVF